MFSLEPQRISRLLLPFLLLCLSPFQAQAQAPTWCGKYYEIGSLPVNPGGQFPLPTYSPLGLLNFNCAPTLRPYVFPEDQTGGIVVDAGFSHYAGFPIDLPIGTPFSIEIFLGDTEEKYAEISAVVGLDNQESTLSLSSLVPRFTPYNLTCLATFPNGQQALSSDELAYLPPNPYGGSATKYDTRTGFTLVRANASVAWEPIFPIGFYTSYGGYLETNLTILDSMKARGYNLVHPVPPYDNSTALSAVVDRMEALGLWLMYDMRWTYTNATSVTEQVNSMKNRSNLLLWYTGDEPDGTSDPLNATSTAKSLIYSLDGYHPVSLVLNCQDYYWTDYTAGADIIMEDPYPIDINSTFSTVWGTACTPELGDCGCDNCVGNFSDITNRVDTFAQRRIWSKRTRNLTTWHVPQGFGNDTYWPRYPTGQEWLVQSALAINHGARGILSWDEPTTSDIESFASLLALALPTLTTYLADPTALWTRIEAMPTIDISCWSVQGRSLVMIVNMEYSAANVSFPTTAADAQPVIESGGTLSIDHGQVRVSLDPIGVLAFTY